MASLLAACWLGAGAAAVGLGAAREVWAAVVVGVFGVAYGLVWVRVAHLGRRLEWPRRPSTRR